ncbi:hypothetical protein A2U01_0032942, partial [Trifolium medium]|nr:hypothetical protein [Trifolium medium]
DQASDGQIKDEINRSMNADCFWNRLENFGCATDVSCLNSVSPDSLMIKDGLDRYIELLNLLNPIEMQNKMFGEEFASMLDEMKQLRASMSMTDSMIEKNTLIVLSKKILSRRSTVAHILASQRSNTNHSQGAVNSGHGKAKGKKNKPKKNKGGKKGKK